MQLENSQSVNNIKDEEISLEPQSKKKRVYGFKEDPFVFFTEEEAAWKNIKSFFDINENNSKNFNSTQLLTRSLTGKKKNIYFCSKAVKVWFC